MITFRKTKAGKWVAYGPYVDLKDAKGTEITVTKRSGETTVRTCRRVGKPFQVDGREMVYAYLDDDKGRRGGSHSKGGRRCELCGSTRGVHLVYDLSGIPGDVCRRCDDGAVSFA